MASGVFLFVDVDDPTSRRSKANKPASQRYTREARKHVMRDIGLSRRKEKPTKVPAPRTTSHELNLVDGPAKRAQDSDGEQNAANVQTNGARKEESVSPLVLREAGEDTECLSPIPARNVGGYRQDPFVNYPVELDYRARQLLDTLLDTRVQGLRAFRIAWYNVSLLDESTFNQVLSIAAIGLGKLQKNPAATEIERQTADYDTWDMHMRALQRILDTRGGVDSITMFNLRFLLFLIDAAGCCTRDVRPRFRLPTQILPDVNDLYSEHSVSSIVNEQLTRLLLRYPSAGAISEIIRDLSVIVQWFEYETNTDPYFYQPSNISGIWLVPLVHRCLDLIPNERDEIEQSELMMLEALRHATILFMQPIRKRFGINTGSSDLRVRKLKAILQQSRAQWHDFEPLFRWMLVAARMEARMIEDQVWFAGVMALHEPFQQMSEDEHLDALRAFIWKEDVFEEPFAEFMDQVNEIKNSSPMWPPPKSTFHLCARR